MNSQPTSAGKQAPIYSSQVVNNFYCYSLSLLQPLVVSSAPAPSRDPKSAPTTPDKSKNTPDIPRHPLQSAFSPTLVFQYPTDIGKGSGLAVSKSDYRSLTSLPQHLEMFCFPHQNCHLNYPLAGKTSSKSSSSSGFITTQPKCHSFVTTDDAGVKQYSVCLTFYRPLSSSQQKLYEDAVIKYRKSLLTPAEFEYVQSTIDKYRAVCDHLSELARDPIENSAAIEVMEEQCQLYRTLLHDFPLDLVKSSEVQVPIVIGLIGYWPFYAFYRDWLVFMYKNEMHNLERHLVHLFREIPLPPSGQFELLIPMRETLNLTLSRPALNQASLPKSISFYPLFATLSLENLVRAFEAVIFESRILVVSNFPSLLNACAEALTSFLYPLFWQHVYIPVLPIQLMDYIQAPFPYIMGVSQDMVKDDLSDIVIINLDKHKITVNGQDISRRPQILPSKERRKLLSRLERVSKLHSAETAEYHAKIMLSDATRKWWSTDSGGRKDEDMIRETLRRFVLPEYLQTSTTTNAAVWNAASYLTGWRRSSVQHSPAIVIDKSLAEASLTSASLDSVIEIPPSTEDSSVSGSDPSLNEQEQQLPKPMIELHTRDTSNNTFVTIQTHISAEEANDKSYTSSQQSSPSSTRKDDSTDPLQKAVTINLATSFKKLNLADIVIATSPHYLHYLFSLKCPEEDAVDKKTGDETSWIHCNLHIPGPTCSNSLSLAGTKLTRATCPLITYRIKQRLEPGFVVDGDPKMTFTELRREGHFFCSSLVLADTSQLASNIYSKKPNISETGAAKVGLGWCQVCEAGIIADVVVGDQMVMTKSGLAILARIDSSETNELLQCRKCRMMVHPACLEHLTDYCSACFDEKGVQISFFKVWTSLLGDYKRFLIPDGEKPPASTTSSSLHSSPTNATPDDTSKVRTRLENAWNRFSFRITESAIDLDSLPKLDIFNCKGFILESAPDSKGFLAGLLATQAFTQFVYDRNGSMSDGGINYESLFFDECIDARLNKSIIVGSNLRETPFLKDQQYTIQKQVATLGVNTKGLSKKDQERSMFTENEGGELQMKFDSRMCCTPRSHRTYVTEKDAMKLRVYTNAILRKSRTEALEKQKKRQNDLTQWFKPLLSKRQQSPSKESPKLPDTPEKRETDSPQLERKSRISTTRREVDRSDELASSDYSLTTSAAPPAADEASTRPRSQNSSTILLVGEDDQEWYPAETTAENMLENMMLGN